MFIIMNTKFIYTLSGDYYSVNLDKLQNILCNYYPEYIKPSNISTMPSVFKISNVIQRDQEHIKKYQCSCDKNSKIFSPELLTKNQFNC